MDLAKCHDAQKYGYIFLYLLIHTRNYIEENPGYINKDGDHFVRISMISKLYQILSSGDIKYMLYIMEKVLQLTCTKNNIHEALTPSISMYSMPHH